jgi:uncharacterized protein YutE (UPF0331/DUF86 family)
LNRLKVTETAKRIETYLSDLEKQKPIDGESLKDRNKLYIVSFLIQQATNDCVSLGNHAISSLDLRLPSSAREVFEILAESGLISEETVAAMKDFVRVRNLIAHRYVRLSLEELADVANRTNVIKDFLNQLLASGK